MITLTEKPAGITLSQLLAGTSKPPVSLSDCWRWCLQADTADAVSTPGSQATVVVHIPVTCTVPANGTVLKIWGYDFTVNNANEFTGTTFQVHTSGATTVFNFIAMMQSNLFFADVVTIVNTLPSDYVVTITWKDCREQPRFVTEQMVFTAITSLGGSGAFTNGVSPVYVDGFKVITRFGLSDANTFTALSPKIGLTTDQQCTTVGPVCVDYSQDAGSVLFTLLPALTSTSRIEAVDNATSMMRFFSLQYGWVYRNNCQPRSGTIIKGDFILGLNAAFNIDDAYQMRRYWYGHPDGYPTGQYVSDYLTTIPKQSNLCMDSFAWLWLLNTWQHDYGTYDLLAHFVLYNAAGAVIETYNININNHISDAHSFHDPVCFNISPAYVLSHASIATANTLVRFDVTVFGTADGTTALFSGTEYLSFLVENCCQGNTDLYVLTPAGGFATQVVEIVDRTVVKNGQEVNLQVPCSSDREGRAKYGGRTMVNLRTYEKITFRFQLPRSEESYRWMKHVRQSPQTMIKVPSEGVYSIGSNDRGAPLAKKFIIDPATTQIYKTGEGIEFTATGYLQDIATQQGTEK